MIVKIWRVLAQILFYRNDLIEIIKPFFENLKNENINDEKFIPLLKTFSKNQLKALYENGIISEEKLNLFLPKNQCSTIEEIISGDKVKELRKLLQEKNIKTFNTVIKYFLEVEKMEISLIQYCIMKKAIGCFKYLLVNGFDDPNKTMKEQNPYPEDNLMEKNQHGYEWDCMATAIYFGNKEIIKILEEKGIEKGNPSHLEAAIFSYRYIIAKEIIKEMNDIFSFLECCNPKIETETILTKSSLKKLKNSTLSLKEKERKK